MGWDARLVIDAGAETPTPLEVDYYNSDGFGWSMTWNVSPMYREAFGHSITALDSLPAPEAAAKMEAALAKMEAEPERYRAMNPPNGWGDYEGAMRVLRQMASVCREYPKATFSIQ